ncbi:MAG: preprotein translocase subunit SecF [Parcubacteria group bacterium Gr01-1014_44]|nr:MAG: preprotein translocase subunit SecF [Parcubacteria group bacterium Gr01-1014_44]
MGTLFASTVETKSMSTEASRDYNMKKVYTILFFISLSFFALSILALAVYGLNFGVDFKGGTVLEVEFSANRPEITELQKAISDKFPDLETSINYAGDRGMIMRTSEISEEQHQQILNVFKEHSDPPAGEAGMGKLEEKRFDSIGPAIGQELRIKSFKAIGIVLIVIAVYMTIVFRKLSRTLSLLAMNLATLVALLHDIIIPMGVFAVLGHYYNVQISGVFVAAALTILGYTVSDKVVIFDRVRENILRGDKDNLGDIVHKSVRQTLVRSINNTLTVVFSSVAIYLFGGESIKYFALALILGISLGAYSSIFVSSPLLVWWSKKK